MLQAQALKHEVQLQHSCWSSDGLQGTKRIKTRIKQKKTPNHFKQASSFETFHYILTCKTYRNVPQSYLTSVYFLETPLDLCNTHAGQRCTLPSDTQRSCTRGRQVPAARNSLCSLTTATRKLSSSFTACCVWTAYRVSVCKYHVHRIENESLALCPPLPRGYKKITLTLRKERNSTGG